MKRFSLALGIAIFSLSVFASEVPSLEPALIYAARHNLLPLAAQMIARGVSVNERDLMGNTPLHHAVRHPGMVKFLLENGADVNARNLLGETALHLSVRHKQTVEHLLAGGADKTIRTIIGRTVVDYCVFGYPRRKTLEVLMLLYSE